jgi:antitoxin CcdA
MGRYVTVSTKVRKELRDEARRLGINISEFLRKALEEEVRRRRIELLKKRIEEISGVLERIDIERITHSIREDRERG